MGEVSASTSTREIKFLEEKLTDEILRAMSCDRLDKGLYQYILKVENLEDEITARIDSKRLTFNNITDIIGSLTSGDFPLLLRITDLNVVTPTNLEKELIAGGATKRIIMDAKNLRANASIREAQILASGLFNQEDRMTDVQIRIQTLTNSIVEEYDESKKPAKIIWRTVLNELTQKMESVDPHKIYKQDPYLLLGAVCGISDECRIDWG